MFQKSKISVDEIENTHFRDSLIVKIKNLDYHFVYKFAAVLSHEEKYFWRTLKKDKFVIENPFLFESYRQIKFVGRHPLHIDKKGFYNNLRYLAELPESHLPEMIVLNSGPWHFLSSIDETLWVLDNFSVYEKKIIFHHLERIASKSKVIFMFAASHKLNSRQTNSEYDNNLRYGTINKAATDYITLSHQFLMPKNVIFWNSIQSSFTEEYEYCLHEGFSNSDSKYKCGDAVHYGKKVNEIGTNMLFNFVCDPSKNIFRT